MVRVKGVAGPILRQRIAASRVFANHLLSLLRPLWNVEFLVGLQPAQFVTDDSKSVLGFDISVAVGSGKYGRHFGLAFSLRLCCRRGESVHAPL